MRYSIFLIFLISFYQIMGISLNCSLAGENKYRWKLYHTDKYSNGDFMQVSLYDSKSITFNGVFIRVWDKCSQNPNYPSPLINEKGEPILDEDGKKKFVKADLILREFDCSKRIHRVLEMHKIFRDQPTEIDTTISGWMNIAPGDPIETLYNIICHKHK